MSDISVRVIDDREQGGDSAFYDSNIYTPPPNRIVIALNYVIQIAVEAVPTPTVSGNGLSWTNLIHRTFDHAGVDRGAVTVSLGLGGSPTNGRTRVSYPQTQLRNAMTLIECVNVDISSGGVNAVPQIKGAKIAAGVTTTPSITLDNPASQANNAVIGICGYGHPTAINPAVAPGLGFSFILNNPTIETGGQASMFRGILQQLCDWDNGVDNTFAWCPIALELKNAEAPPDPDAPQVIGRPSFIQGNLITP